MGKTEFCFFQITIKLPFWNTVELGQPTFSKGPKRLDTINVPVASGEFILAVIHAVMLVVADIYQAVISGPISVYTWPCRLKIPKTIVLPEAPRPRLPGIPRGPK